MKDFLETFIETMGTYTETKGAGVTRLPFSREQKKAKQYIKQTMERIGLTVYEDDVGTVIGFIEGKRKETILLGSHYDSVPSGGKYDGIAGIGVALYTVKKIIEAGIQPKYSIAVATWNDEEGILFNDGFLSSKCFTGMYTKEELQKIQDANGKSVLAYIEEKLPSLLTYHFLSGNPIKEYVEVHTEQGKRLETEHKTLGIVTCIPEISHIYYKFIGEMNHAGTTALEDRKDPVIAGSRFIVRLSEIAERYKESTITTGHIKVEPDAVNVIAESMECSVDVRSHDEKIHRKLLDEIEFAAKKNCSLSKGVSYKKTMMMHAALVPMSKEIQKRLEKCIKECGYTYMKIASKAGHDAQILAQICPVGMLFVPSRGGISHSPMEYTDLDDLMAATEVLVTYLQENI